MRINNPVLENDIDWDNDSVIKYTINVPINSG